MKKRVLSLMLIASTLVTLTGCGDSDTISELNNISALNAESSVSSNYSLSYTDEQEMIYAQVSNRQLLDLSALSACSSNEIQQVRNYMDNIDNQLVGKVKVVDYDDDLTRRTAQGLVTDDAVVNATLTDYLLSFMQQTPYYWQRTKTTIRGIDSKSRSIIVDVTYKTINYEKEVQDDSTITLGDPNYDTLVKSRYTKYINILATQLNNPTNPNLPQLINDFKTYWGEPEDIIEEQNKYKPTTCIYNTGNQKTYSGLINSDAEKSTGTMTVRYVLVPEYVLGINLGVECKHMYITEFSLDNDVTKNMSAFTQEGYQTVTDSVYSLIYSYFTALDESDYDGLYKLTNNFNTLDKHYQDVFDSTYQKHDGYSVSLFDITGTHIKCGVTISTKERAKNSNMTLPVYTDRYYMELELVGDTLKVDNMVLLSRKLEGEPAISEDEVEDTGFSANIDLDNDDKVAIEKLICNFSAIQLQEDTTSDNFSSLVDTSITTNQLSALKTNMTSLSGSKKVVFLQNYQQGTSNYASVKCKELFQDDKNAIVEATTTYEFIMKGGNWYIYNYDVNSSVKLDTTNLTTTGSLCLVSPGKVESYTSQIKGSTSTNLDEVSDISVSFDHKSYTPTEKEGNVEQGYVQYTSADITAEEFNLVNQTGNFAYSSIDDLNKDIEDVELALTSSEGSDGNVGTIIYQAMATYLNVSNSYYMDDVSKQDAIDTAKANLSNANSLLNNLKTSNPSVDTQCTNLTAIISSLGVMLQ